MSAGSRLYKQIQFSDQEEQYLDALHGGSEPERANAAVALGLAGACNHLLEAVFSAQEGLRRAATWGLTAAGGLAAPLLVQLLRSADGHSSEVLASVAFSLGAASEQLSVKDLAAAVRALSIGCDVLRKRIYSHTKANGKSELAKSVARPERSAAVRQCVENETDATMTTLRQALACIAGASGRIGARAARADAVKASDHAANVLLLLLEPESDIEEVFPSHYTAAAVRWNAAQGLLVMASDPRYNSASHPLQQAKGGWYAHEGGVEARVGEALRRVQVLCDSGKATAAHIRLAKKVRDFGWGKPSTGWEPLTHTHSTLQHDPQREVRP
jgi:predicted fused transcriptional regulator/phosphomethylpyrimidine kinase